MEKLFSIDELKEPSEYMYLDLTKMVLTHEILMSDEVAEEIAEIVKPSNPEEAFESIFDFDFQHYNENIVYDKIKEDRYCMLIKTEENKDLEFIDVMHDLIQEKDYVNYMDDFSSVYGLDLLFKIKDLYVLEETNKKTGVVKHWLVIESRLDKSQLKVDLIKNDIKLIKGDVKDAL